MGFLRRGAIAGVEMAVRPAIIQAMEEKDHGPFEFTTLEGMDYNLLRKAESLARAEFCRPENRGLRQKRIESLFPKGGPVDVRMVEPCPGPPPKVL